MIAAIYSNIDSNIETIKLLLENRANINLENDNGQTALMLTATNLNKKNNI